MELLEEQYGHGNTVAGVLSFIKEGVLCLASMLSDFDAVLCSGTVC